MASIAIQTAVFVLMVESGSDVRNNKFIFFLRFYLNHIKSYYQQRKNLSGNSVDPGQFVFIVIDVSLVCLLFVLLLFHYSAPLLLVARGRWSARTSFLARSSRCLLLSTGRPSRLNFGCLENCCAAIASAAVGSRGHLPIRYVRGMYVVGGFSQQTGKKYLFFSRPDGNVTFLFVVVVIVVSLRGSVYAVEYS